MAVLNNNYLMTRVARDPGVSAPYAKGRRRIEQVRYCWEELARDTGVHSEEIGSRVATSGRTTGRATIRMWCPSR